MLVLPSELQLAVMASMTSEVIIGGFVVRLGHSHVIYWGPQIFTTDLTEEEVRQEGMPHEVGARFRETSPGHIMG